MKPLYIERMYYENEFNRMRVTYRYGGHTDVLYITESFWLNNKYNTLPPLVLEDRLVRHVLECITYERENL